jgi:tape measure domain-containing protein
MAGGVVRELVTLWGFDIDKKPLQELDVGINTIKSSLKAVGIAAAAVGGAIGLLLNEAGKQEQTNVAFETILGGAEEAKKAIAELQQFASSTPFTIPGIEKNAKQLLAVGIESNKLIPTLKALGDVSAGLSVPLERIALNYGQIRTQNKLTGRDLRDFAVAGVPLLGVLAKQFGVTEAAVTGMVSAGKVGFADVEKAFVSMTSDGGRFADLMDKQSKTLKGMISNAQDFGIILARELGQELLPKAKEIVSTFIDWLKVNRDLIKGNLIVFMKSLVTFFSDLVGITKTLFKSMSGIVGIFGGWNKVLSVTFKVLSSIMGLGLLVGVGLITKALWTMVAGWTANALVMAANVVEGFALLGVQGGLIYSMKLMGNSALVAQAKMMLIPLAIGAIVAAIALIAEDIIAFTQGRDSVFGRMLGGLDQVFTSMREKFGIFGSIGKYLLTAVLTPVRIIVNAFKNLFAIIDIFRGKLSVFEAGKKILGNIGNVFGMGTDTARGAFGLAENVGRANEAASANNNPIAGLGGMPFSSAEGAAKAVSVEAKNEINLNVTGMNPDDAKELVTTTLQGELGGMLRDTVRDGESQIER